MTIQIVIYRVMRWNLCLPSIQLFNVSIISRSFLDLIFHLRRMLISWTAWILLLITIGTFRGWMFGSAIGISLLGCFAGGGHVALLVCDELVDGAVHLWPI